MTMEHIARSCDVSLCVTHPTIDPAKITTALDLAPKLMTRVGAPRKTPGGKPMAGVYKFSRWVHNFDVKGASELGAVLEDLAERLQKHRQFFHRVVRDGGSVKLFCGVYADGNWDEDLSHSLMGKLAALQVGLRLDVYPEDDTVV